MRKDVRTVTAVDRKRGFTLEELVRTAIAGLEDGYASGCRVRVRVGFRGQITEVLFEGPRDSSLSELLDAAGPG